MPAAENTLTICGLAAVQAIAQKTPQLIERLFFDADHAPLFADVCKKLALSRKIYRLVSADELRKISDTGHHQGAVAVIQKPSPTSIKQLSPTAALLCLHDVLNPHNVGAILRTAAFFGARHLLVSQQTFNAAMTAAAWRVAEGGLTYIQLYAYNDASEFFLWSDKVPMRPLAAVKPEGKTARTLGEFLRDRNAPSAIICLGNEEAGLPQSFISRCSGRFSIQGAGVIDSLNVSVTAAICLHQLAGKIAGLTNS